MKAIIEKIMDKATTDNKSVNKAIKAIYIPASIIIIIVFILSKI